MPYHSSLFYLTSFKTAEQYVGEIVRMDEEGEWENAEVGGWIRKDGQTDGPGSLKSLYWNGNVGQKNPSASSSSRAPSSHITASDLFEPLTIVPLKMVVLDRPEKQHAGTSGMQYVYVSPDSRSCLYTKWWMKVFN